MTALQATKTKASSDTTRTGRLFFLELSGNRIHSMNPDGSDRKTIVTNCHLPDGIVVDAEASHIYWTNMGVPNLNDGSIERADLDGKNRRVIVPQGVTHTPKQIHLDSDSGKLYWCDREGMRVMRANLDGTNVQTLVRTGDGEVVLSALGNELHFARPQGKFVHVIGTLPVRTPMRQCGCNACAARARARPVSAASARSGVSQTTVSGGGEG